MPLLSGLRFFDVMGPSSELTSYCFLSMQFIEHPYFRSRASVANLLTVLGWAYVTIGPIEQASESEMADEVAGHEGTKTKEGNGQEGKEGKEGKDGKHSECRAGAAARAKWQRLFVPLLMEAQRKQLQYSYGGSPRRIDDLVEALLYGSGSDVKDSKDSNDEKDSKESKETKAGDAAAGASEEAGDSEGEAETSASTVKLSKGEIDRRARAKKAQAALDERFAAWAKFKLRKSQTR